MALAASIFGGMNVLLEWALKEDTGPTVDTMRDKIGRATVFALYRDVGAAGVLLLLYLLPSPVVCRVSSHISVVAWRRAWWRW